MSINSYIKQTENIVSLSHLQINTNNASAMILFTLMIEIINIGIGCNMKRRIWKDEEILYSLNKNFLHQTLRSWRT